MKLPTGIKKYYVGLAILGVFTLVITIFVLLLASAAKQDTNTYNKANDIATKLNSYIDKQQTVPTSFNAAGINNVPSTITYTKNSDSAYTFCATYRSASSNFSSNGIDALSGSVLTQQQDIDPGIVGTYSDNSELYIDSTHHKGQNCQTVKPYITTSYCSGIDLNDNCYVQNNISSGSSSGQPSTNDTDRKTDVATVLAAITDYIDNNDGALPDPASINVQNGSLTIGPTGGAATTLKFYTKAGQVAAKQFVVGDKNTTVDNMVVELGAVCSGSDPAAGSSRSEVVLYSDSTGYQCQQV